MTHKLLASFIVTALLNGYPSLSLSGEAKEMTDKRAIAAFVLKQPVFNYLDCEGEGAIEKGEVDEHFSQVFFIQDKDRSRYISKSEYISSKEHDLKKEQEQLFKLIDTDSNGKISATEYRLYLYEMIELADIDSDGEVTLQELVKIQNHQVNNSSK